MKEFTIKLKTSRTIFTMAMVLTLSYSAVSCSQKREAPSADLTEDEISKIKISDSTTSKLQLMFEREHLYQHLSGAVLIAHDDSILHQASYNIEGKEDIHDDTRFDIGSLTKQFTAAAILTLVNEQKMGLNDLINPLLGEHASERWDKVTVHHLLTHTSGIPSIFQTEQGLDIFFPETNPISVADLIQKFKNGKLLFKPSEEFSYSNSGYVLLAAIIEQVSGERYYDYMEDHIFARYGLKNTSLLRDTNAANPYYGYRNDLLKQAPVFHQSWMYGAGGAYSTVGDLSKWLDTITSPNFLTADLRSQFLRSHTNQGYGYGWVVKSDGYVEHDGGTAGFSSLVKFDPKVGTKLIVLTNRSFEDIRYYGQSAKYTHSLVSKSLEVLRGNDIEILPAIISAELTTKSYLLNGKTIEIMPHSDTSAYISSTGIQPSRLIKNTPLEGNTEEEQKLLGIASAIKKKKYWQFAKYCDGEMKFVSYIGLMSYGMKMMKRKTGDVSSITPFYVDDIHGLLHMKGEQGNLDLIVYFDDDGRVTGMFENGFTEQDQSIHMIAYPVEGDKIYLDGLPMGENSLTLIPENDQLRIMSEKREVTAKMIKN